MKSNGRSAHDYRQGLPEVVGMRLPPGVHLATRPSPQYGPYWETLFPPKQRPRRRLRMVPDDRTNETDGRGAA